MKINIKNLNDAQLAELIMSVITKPILLADIKIIIKLGKYREITKDPIMKELLTKILPTSSTQYSLLDLVEAMDVYGKSNDIPKGIGTRFLNLFCGQINSNSSKNILILGDEGKDYKDITLHEIIESMINYSSEFKEGWWKVTNMGSVTISTLENTLTYLGRGDLSTRLKISRGNNTYILK